MLWTGEGERRRAREREPHTKFGEAGTKGRNGNASKCRKELQKSCVPKDCSCFIHALCVVFLLLGISLLIAGSFVPGLYYSYYCFPYARNVYLGILAVLVRNLKTLVSEDDTDRGSDERREGGTEYRRVV